MSTNTQVSNAQERAGAGSTKTVDQKLEVVVIPVSDVERSKRFYEGLGWRLDADFTNGPTWRAIQMTPPGSPCSIHFGTAVTPAAPGSVKNLFLVVSDITAARAELMARGADVTEPFHFKSIGGPPEPGLHPDRATYMTYASFSDPDGNSWLLQEIGARFPGRGFSTFDVPALTELLREAEQQHGGYEAKAPKHHWSDFYAGYIVARQQGRTPVEAAEEGARSVEETRARAVKA